MKKKYGLRNFKMFEGRCSYGGARQFFGVFQALEVLIESAKEVIPTLSAERRNQLCSSFSEKIGRIENGPQLLFSVFDNKLKSLCECCGSNFWNKIVTESSSKKAKDSNKTPPPEIFLDFEIFEKKNQFYMVLTSFFCCF